MDLDSVKLVVNPYSDEILSYINGKAVSQYSELNNYVKEPLLLWADKIIDVIDKEINDDFELVVCGEPFVCSFFRDLQKEFESCQRYKTEQYLINTPIDTRIRTLQKFAEQSGVNISDYEIPENVLVCISGNALVNVTVDNYEVVISNNDQIINKAMQSSSVRLIITEGEDNMVKRIRDGLLLWEINSTDLENMVDEAINYFNKVEYVKKIFTKLINNTSKTNLIDYDEVLLSNRIEPIVKVKPIPEIKIGDYIKTQIEIIPREFETPAYRIESLNEHVAGVEGNTIVPLATGKTIIRFYKQGEIMPFGECPVSVYMENYVQKINLNIEKSKMAIGDEQLISAEIIPADADDAQNCKWIISNDCVGSIDERGMFVAKDVGETDITLYSRKTKGVINVEVLPDIQEINLTKKEVKMFVGESERIGATLEPQHVYDPRHEWKTSDREVAYVYRKDDGHLEIKAAGIGTCEIICEAIKGNAKAVCFVQVDSTLNRGKRNRGLLFNRNRG